jgi:hypothetical protein
MQPLTSDAMSSDDSKDKRNNATAKSGGQGYFSEDNYQSHRESSQGKQDHLQRNESQDKGCTEKRMRELEDKLYELEENNKKLKAELKVSKKSNSKSTKGDIQNTNDWTGEGANLADKVMEFCKDFLFPRYKFLKDGCKSYKPETDKSFCYFVGKNMAHTYKNMRIATAGLTFEDEWDKIYVPVIGLKYTHMRCNLGSNIRVQYFGEFNV